MCIYERCKLHPSFNIKTESKALYCSLHKLEGMVDIKHPKCIYKDCISRPSFNLEGNTKAIYCKEHKNDGMIDIISKRCIYEGCIKRPCFNLQNESSALYCNTHKLSNMIDIMNKNKKCKTHLCQIRSIPKYENYCLTCYMNLFPDKPVAHNYKTKEKDVVDRVKETFPDFTWVHDKKIQDGCSKRRPDLLLDMGSHIIIVEIDENKHTDYDCSCENKRLMELSQDVGHRPIVFIRFNPDDYNDGDGNTIKSCWKVNKLGIIQIDKKKIKEWELRINTLKTQIQYWITNSTEKTVEIIELFY